MCDQVVERAMAPVTVKKGAMAGLSIVRLLNCKRRGVHLFLDKALKAVVFQALVRGGEVLLYQAGARAAKVLQSQ